MGQREKEYGTPSGGRPKVQDMTRGPVVRPLVSFTIPLVLGNLFQLLYNAVDSAVVGRFVGEDALAAVGTATPVMNMVILLISGLCMGAGILMSSYYGAKEYEVLRRQIGTTMLAGSAFSVGLSVLMLLLARPILLLIRVPARVIPQAQLYLSIVFLGTLFTFLYNLLANTLRALGDSKTPLYFLVLCAILNGTLDLLLVAVLSWGVAGSAVATVASQAVSCLLCLLYIRKRVPLLNLGRQWLVWDRSLLKKTVAFSSTSAMQQMCLQLGKTVIQAVVNTQGVSVMAAFAAVNRVDDFAYTPQQNIGHAMTTFIAQNQGAGHRDRIRKGFAGGLLIEAVYSILLLCFIYLAAPQIMGWFVKKGETQVIDLGVSYLHLIAAMYLLPALTNGIQGFFRGIGDLKVTLQSTFMNMLGRVTAVIVLVYGFSVGFVSLAWANLAGWIVMLLFETPLLVRQLRSGLTRL